MTEEQMRALMAWIDARIAEKIEDAFGRDSLMEARQKNDARRALESEMGWREWVLR